MKNEDFEKLIYMEDFILRYVAEQKQKLKATGEHPGTERSKLISLLDNFFKLEQTFIKEMDAKISEREQQILSLNNQLKYKQHLIRCLDTTLKSYGIVTDKNAFSFVKDSDFID